MIIRQGNPLDPEPRALLEASHALMQSLFPADSNHYLEVEALAAPDITFLIAEIDGKPLGCAALARKPGYGELKSMFVAQSARGKGIAAALLREIERIAQAEGIPILRLETGDLLTAAHRLYERHGFKRCAAFGDYPADGPHSVYMEKTLTP